MLAAAATGADVVAAVYAADSNLTRLDAEAAELGLDTADLTMLVTVDGDNGLLGEALSMAGIIYGWHRPWLDGPLRLPVNCLATGTADFA